MSDPMYVYFGPISGVNGWKPEEFLGLANSIRNAHTVALSIDPDEVGVGVFYDSKAIAAFFSLVNTANKPVFVRVGLAPSDTRPSASMAVDSALMQMAEIYYLFTAYNLTNLLAGFAFNNFAPYTMYADGSRMSRDQLNQLVTTAHDTYNVRAMVFASDAIDAVSRTEPRTLRAPTGPANAQAATALGQNAAYQDILVTINPVFPIHLVLQSNLDSVVDVTRLMGTLALAKRTSSASLVHAVVQGPILDWSYSNSYAQADLLLGQTISNLPLQSFRNAKHFLTNCGFPLIGLVSDSAFGQISHISIDTTSIPLYDDVPLYDISNVDTPSFTNLFSNKSIIVQDWSSPSSDPVVVEWDSQLNPITRIRE